MQNSSSQFNDAMIAGSVVWAKPLLHAYWDPDNPSSLDNLTEQVGDQFTVSHALDDGLPDAVSSSVASDPVGSVSIGLTGTTVSGEVMDPRQYFSPFNTNSPVVSYDRDTAAVQLDMGAITENGQEYVTVFLGQMVNIVLSGRAATLQAISATRLLLAKAVKAPLMDGLSMGANASAIVSWILYDCGIQICPWPITGTRWWAPFHGSSVSFLPNYPSNYGNLFSDGYSSRYFTDAGVFTRERPNFIQGKFLAGSDTTFDGFVGQDIVNAGLDLGPGDQYFSAMGSKARVEFWMYGGGWGPVGYDNLFELRIQDQASSGVYLRFIVDDTHEIQFLVSGTNYYTGLVIPGDDQWHFVGMYYDIAGNKLTATLDGREFTITPSPAFNASALSLTDNTNGLTQLIVKHRVSDLMFTTGTNSDPTVQAWNSYLAYTAGTLIASEDWEDTTYNITWSGTWARDNTQAQAGTWSLKSAAIGNLLITDAHVLVPSGAEELRFWHRVSTEEGFDYFYLLYSLDFDDFTRSVSNGLGTSMGNHTWTLSGGANSDYQVTGTAATIAMSAVNSQRAPYLSDMTLKDCEATVNVTIPIAPTGAGNLQAGIMLRRSSGSTTLLCLLNVAVGNAVTLTISQFHNGVGAVLATSGTLFTHTAGNTYGITFRADGDTVMARAWNTTGNQPSDFAITATTTLLDAGSPGMFETTSSGITNTTPITFTWDNWKVRPLTPLWFKSGVLNTWYPATIGIPAGCGQVTFRYMKDTAATGGSDAVWIDTIEFRDTPTVTDSFQPAAIVRFIDLELQAVTDTEAREAWAYLSDIAQSSMTAMRTDEIDRLCMLTPAWFVESDQQQQAEVLSTSMNAQDPDITLDPTKIRNSIQVNFSDTRVDTSWTYVYASTTAITVPKGSKMIVDVTFDRPATGIDETMTVEPDITPLVTTPTSRLFANTAADGSGTYLNDTQFTASILSWDSSSASVQLWNKTNATAYVANNIQDSYPFFGIAGFAVTSSDSSATMSESQPRGERTLTVSPPLMQRKDNAQRLAASILFLTRQARAEVTVTVMGDPRRQPGDLVSLVDSQGTQITGLWRVVEIEHDRSGAQYIQKLSLRKAHTMALWDDASTGWDEGVWG